MNAAWRRLGSWLGISVMVVLLVIQLVPYGRNHVNPRFGAHLHLVVELDEDQIPEIARRLFTYLERAHGWVRRRQWVSA